MIATGTGNDVADFDLPRRNPRAAVEVILRERSRRIDLARTGAGYYVTVLASGFDSLVNERANDDLAEPRCGTTWRHLPELRVLEPLAYTLELDGERRQSRRSWRRATGRRTAAAYGCEGALLDDGLLNVVIISPLSRLKVVALYPRLFNGSHGAASGVLAPPCSE